jgi:uncharacterized membrane protein
MVLEIKVPHGDDLAALRSIAPAFAIYALSFVYVGIYWNNHHHMLHATQRIDGRSLWANLHLLFWLSLVPVTTAWVGEHATSPWPTALYGVILLAAGLAYAVLVIALVAFNGRDSPLARATGSGRKEMVSLVLYLLALALCFVRTWLADLIYLVVALMWLVPDRRIEKVLRAPPPTP